MRKSLLQFLVCLPLVTAFGYSQSGANLQSGRHQFQLPDGMTTDDYWQNKVVFKVKESLRAYCSATRIEIPAFSRYLDAVGATGLVQSYPHADRPSEKVNSLGQPLADLSLIYEVDYSGNADIENAVNLLLETGIAEYAEPSYIFQPFFDPDDPDTAGQYYLNLIHARQAWDISKGDSTIVIGIIDTGTSFLHPDLMGKFALNYADPIDGIDNDNNGYIDDYHGWDFGGDLWGEGGDNDPSWNGVAS